MRKKIFMGCIIVVTILILMPIVPAVHINSNENETKIEYKKASPLSTGIEFDLPDKFPLLYYIVLAIGYFRIYRCNLFWDIAIEEGYWPGEIYIKHPLLLIRSLIIGSRAHRWIEGWGIISNILGLDWDLDF